MHRHALMSEHRLSQRRACQAVTLVLDCYVFETLQEVRSMT